MSSTNIPAVTAINALLSRCGRRFDLIGPTQLTVKYRNGDYRKISVAGGEDYVPSGAYLGKRGDLICIFKPAHPQEYSHMELKASEFHVLSGFERYLQSEFGDGYGLDRANTAAPDSADPPVKAEKVTKEIMMQNPNYATW